MSKSRSAIGDNIGRWLSEQTVSITDVILHERNMNGCSWEASLIVHELIRDHKELNICPFCGLTKLRAMWCECPMGQEKAEVTEKEKLVNL